jgi:tripartite-type tricarboxylate transporter receptor subunit TctC
MRLRHSGAFIAIVLFLAASFPVHAQTYPNRPIRFIVPFAAGGGGDIVVRTVAAKLSERLGQNVAVDNRSGAGGSLGTEIASQAPSDGYTILMANVAPMAINVSLHKKLAYDPVKDFAPIALLVTFPNMLVVHPSLPVKSTRQLVDFAKARPGALTYASAGNGSTTHLSAELFQSMAGIKLIHVPYKGGGPALINLIAGEVTMYFGSMPASLPHIRARRLVPLGVTSLKRSDAAPEIPSIAESGFPGFEAVTWIGVVAPKGVPQDIVDRLNKEVTQVLAMPDVSARLKSLGADPLASTPTEFAAYIVSEVGKWAKVVKQSGATVE